MEKSGTAINALISHSFLSDSMKQNTQKTTQKE